MEKLGFHKNIYENLYLRIYQKSVEKFKVHQKLQESENFG